MFGAYALAYLGSPLATTAAPSVGVQFGGVCLIMFGALSIRVRHFIVSNKRSAALAASPWVILCLFALANALVTAVGRCSLGLYSALSSRYVTMANLFWVGLIGLAAVVYSEWAPEWSPANRRKAVLGISTGGILLLMAFLGVQAASFGIVQAQTRRFTTTYFAECDIDNAPEATMSKIYPRPTVLRTRIAEIRTLNDGPFADSASVMAAAHYRTGVLDFQNEQYASAIPELQYASSRLANFAQIHYLLARCYTKTGHLSLADTEMKQAIWLDGEYSSFRS